MDFCSPLFQVKIYGFTDPVHGSVISFLNDHLQRATSYTCWQQVTSGILRGSVVTPTLLLVYIDDFSGSVDVFCFLAYKDLEAYL